MVSTEKINAAVARHLPDSVQFLSDIIKYPSVSGQEHELMLFLEKAFASGNTKIERVPLSDKIKNDPDYCDPVPGIKYDGRFNLRLSRKGSGNGRTLLFNTHTDVVPASEGMHDAWSPRVSDGFVFGRGACDAKGQVALLYLLYKVLDDLGLALKGDVIAHLVNEEENGGNGTLAMARIGEKADGCVVLEPTEGRILPSIRGAVWFKIVFHGVAGHSGSAGQTRSALLMARDAIARLEAYHANLLQKSRGFPLFDSYPNPMPITFGKLHAGNWPAAAPNSATLEGVLGFLPNRDKETICHEMKETLLAGGLTEKDFDLSFMYRHDCSVLDPKHELTQTLLSAAKAQGKDLTLDGMPASCDAWFYNNMLNIPTLVYGTGTLKVAHSINERIAVSDISEAAEVLTRFVAAYCG